MIRPLRAALWVIDLAAAPATSGSVGNAKGEVDRANHQRRAVAALERFELLPEESPTHAAAR